MTRLPKKFSGIGWLIILILTITSVLPDPLNCCGLDSIFTASRTTISIGDTSDDDFDVAKHLQVLPPENAYPKLLPLPEFWRPLPSLAREVTASHLSIFQLNTVYLI